MFGCILHSQHWVLFRSSQSLSFKIVQKPEIRPLLVGQNWSKSFPPISSIFSKRVWSFKEELLEQCDCICLNDLCTQSSSWLAAALITRCLNNGINVSSIPSISLTERWQFFQRRLIFQKHFFSYLALLSWQRLNFNSSNLEKAKCFNFFNNRVTIYHCHLYSRINVNFPTNIQIKFSSPYHGMSNFFFERAASAASVSFTLSQDEGDVH